MNCHLVEILIIYSNVDYYLVKVFFFCKISILCTLCVYFVIFFAAASLTTDLYKTALAELPALISDNDLHISQLVLTLLCTVMEVNPGSIVTVKEHILPNTLSLVLSSLLQGSAMVACLNFFRKLVQLGLPGLDFSNIFRVSQLVFSLSPPFSLLSLFCSPLLLLAS